LSESRKLVAIFAADVVGFSRLAGADEDRILARLRALRSDLIDPTIAVHNGRVVKRTGDGVLAEFRSVVDAVRCAIEVRSSMVGRNAGVPEDRRIVFRIGIHIGDDAAIEASRKAIDGGYRGFLAYLNLAAAHALKGDDSDAKAALDEARRLNPRLSVRWFTEHRPVLEPAFDSLRKVGLPEE
jgi:class 3 adenylate cyclase